MFRQFGIRQTKYERANDLRFQQLGVNQFYGTWKFDRELIEKGSKEGPLHSGNPLEFAEGIVCFGKILFGHFAEAFFPSKVI